MTSIILLSLGCLVLFVVAYVIGYQDARNRYERVNVAVFTPEELKALMIMAAEWEREQEVQQLERMWEGEEQA